MFDDVEVERGVRAYCSFVDENIERVSALNARAYASVPAFAALLNGLSGDALVVQNRANVARIARGAKDGDWQPYVQSLRERGVQYARSGMDFRAWTTVFQRLLVNLVDEMFERVSDREELRILTKGTVAIFDLVVQVVGETFYEEQRAIIRAMSNPVLEAGDGVLLVPLVGDLNDERMRRLLDTLLPAIRAQRARGVIVDLTGVPGVDSAAMKHLQRLTGAASLMGARIVLTGIAPAVCQSLITLGVEMPDAETVATLEDAFTTLES